MSGRRVEARRAGTMTIGFVGAGFLGAGVSGAGLADIFGVWKLRRFVAPRGASGLAAEPAVAGRPAQIRAAGGGKQTACAPAGRKSAAFLLEGPVSRLIQRNRPGRRPGA
ncbi:MAG: hypothetical protein Kow00114_03170 [Kiloniellaceae bacterium]